MVESGYRQIIVMRHAKTEQVGVSDRLRELTRRGRADAHAAGAWLRESGLLPDIVLTSPATRARDTAEIVAGELGGLPEVVVAPDLYGADPDDVLAQLAGLEPGTRSAMVVGHNPTMSELAFDLLAERPPGWLSGLTTSGIVVVEFPEAWADCRLHSATARARYVPASGGSEC